MKDIAALIGRNESGKTSILQALLLFNKDSAILDVDQTDGMEDEMADPAFRIIEGTFELAPEETRAVADLSPELPELKEVTIYRSPAATKPKYDFGELVFPGIFKLQEPTLPAFFQHLDALLSLLQQRIAAATSTQSPGDSATAKAKHGVLDELKGIVGDLERSKGQSKPSRQEIDLLLNSLNSIATDAETETAVGTQRKNLANAAKKLFKKFDGQTEVETLLQSKFQPRFVYFSSYKTVHGAIRLSQYLQGPATPSSEKLDSGESLDKRETIDNLFFLAGLEPARLDSLKTKIAAQNKYLLQCSQRLTQEIQKTWIREDGTTVFCEILYGDDVVRIRVSDVHTDGSQTNKQLLQRRSEGFRWHFSFQVNFRAETKKTELREAILLLDEPGLHIHPAQQERLLLVIRELAADNQILYTTHSPFMIFSYEEGNLLLVESDPATHLSRVNPAFWNGDPTAIIPILHSLGAKAIKRSIDFELAKQLPPVLVVEGGTDYQYIKAFNWLFRRQVTEGTTKRAVLDVEILPANGSTAIGPTALFNEQIGHRVTVLYDNEPDAKKHAEELKKQRFPEDQILFVESEGKPECDIEDMFSENFYLNSVNEVYRVILKSSKFTIIEKKDLQEVRQKNVTVTRIVPVLKKIWESHKAEGWGSFDKVAVCEKICADILRSGKVEEQFAAGFQRLFERIGSATNVSKSAVATARSPQPAGQPKATLTVSAPAGVT